MLITFVKHCVKANTSYSTKLATQPEETNHDDDGPRYVSYALMTLQVSLEQLSARPSLPIQSPIQQEAAQNLSEHPTAQSV